MKFSTPGKVRVWGGRGTDRADRGEGGWFMEEALLGGFVMFEPSLAPPLVSSPGMPDDQKH